MNTFKKSAPIKEGIYCFEIDSNGVIFTIFADSFSECLEKLKQRGYRRINRIEVLD